jgi:hypothetical protein
MKLTHRHRHHRRDAFPRISISEAEITADLIYPAQPRRPAPIAAPARAKRR